MNELLLKAEVALNNLIAEIVEASRINFEDTRDLMKAKQEAVYVMAEIRLETQAEEATRAKQEFSPSSVYDKIIDGDSLSDRELRAATPFFKSLAGDLTLCGPVFRLAATELHRVTRQMESWNAMRSLFRADVNISKV